MSAPFPHRVWLQPWLSLQGSPEGRQNGARCLRRIRCIWVFPWHPARSRLSCQVFLLAQFRESVLVRDKMQKEARTRKSACLVMLYDVLSDFGTLASGHNGGVYQTFTSSCLLSGTSSSSPGASKMGCFCCSCCLFQAASFSRRAFFFASSVSGL